ncbi:hypothetical protein FQZ97_869370 [compost metagenome]
MKPPFPNPTGARPPDEQYIGLDLARTLWPEQFEQARGALGKLTPIKASTAYLDSRMVLFVWAAHSDGQREIAGMSAITREIEPDEWAYLKDHREVA